MKTLKILIIVLVILFVLLLVVLAIFIFSSTQDKKFGTYIDINSINRNEVGSPQIAYMLSQLNAHELHKVPLTKNNPKIELVVGEKLYSVEIVSGAFKISEGNIEDPDIRIYMSEEEFINAMNSDVRGYIQQSVAEGKTEVELLAGNAELFAKGYLQLYDELK